MSEKKYYNFTDLIVHFDYAEKVVTRIFINKLRFLFFLYLPKKK